MREPEKEREREVIESSGKQSKNKGEDGDIWIYVCWTKKKRKKEGNIWMKERKYNYNIFTINL